MNDTPIDTRIESTFLLSAPNLKSCPSTTGVEVAFAGRSNSGKSSVLNQVTDNKSLARVSKTPGRTQLINFFETKKSGLLVDLPGYGYAKSAKSKQAEWQSAVNEYLSSREALGGLILVMDIRHPNQDYDQELLSWSRDSKLPVHVLLNKSDKLGTNRRIDTLFKVRKIYKDFSNVSFQTFSALKGDGKPELISKILFWFNNTLTI